MDHPRSKILVVDDDLQLLDLMIDTLTTIGYEAVGVDSGNKALERLNAEQFDLLITDIKMPIMNGFALLKRVRSSHPKLPALFITGVATPEIIGKAAPNGFLAKPFRIGRLEEQIENALSGVPDEIPSPISRVLVVDDDDYFRDMLTDALQRTGYEPIEASAANAALDLLKKEKVDAVITDLKMPDMDGISLMKEIKLIYPDLPVALITAFMSQDEAGQSSDIKEANGFLQKPFPIDNIVKLLDDLAVTPKRNK